MPERSSPATSCSIWVEELFRSVESRKEPIEASLSDSGVNGNIYLDYVDSIQSVSIFHREWTMRVIRDEINNCLGGQITRDGSAALGQLGVLQVDCLKNSKERFVSDIPVKLKDTSTILVRNHSWSSSQHDVIAGTADNQPI
jgi:hypothetical protein